jgi:hypothetical protein
MPYRPELPASCPMAYMTRSPLRASCPMANMTRSPVSSSQLPNGQHDKKPSVEGALLRPEVANSVAGASCCPITVDCGQNARFLTPGQSTSRQSPLRGFWCLESSAARRRAGCGLRPTWRVGASATWRSSPAAQGIRLRRRCRIAYRSPSGLSNNIPEPVASIKRSFFQALCLHPPAIGDPMIHRKPWRLSMA